MRTDADFVRTPPICATREIRSRSCKKKPPFATSLSAFIRRKLSNEQIKAKDCNPGVHKWKLRFANWICTKVGPQKKSLILINDCPFCEHPSVFFLHIHYDYLAVVATDGVSTVHQKIRRRMAIDTKQTRLQSPKGLCEETVTYFNGPSLFSKDKRLSFSLSGSVALD